MNSEVIDSTRSKLHKEIEEAIRIGDELLGREVTERIMVKAYDWLFYFAQRLGVAQEDITYNFIVRELLSLYAYREVCLKKSYGSLGTAYRGQQYEDFYSQKQRSYDNRIKQLEQTITAQDLTGDTEGVRANYRTVRMYRG